MHQRFPSEPLSYYRRVSVTCLFQTGIQQTPVREAIEYGPKSEAIGEYQVTSDEQ